MTIGGLFVAATWPFLFGNRADAGSLIPWTAYLGGSLIAIVLVVAGIAKLGNKQQFSRTVENYNIVSPGTARMIAAVLPEVEVFVGFLLLIKVAFVFAGALAGVLFCLFATAVGTNLARGRRIACGCFGPSESK